VVTPGFIHGSGREGPRAALGHTAVVHDLIIEETPKMLMWKSSGDETLGEKKSFPANTDTKYCNNKKYQKFKFVSWQSKILHNELLYLTCYCVSRG